MTARLNPSAEGSWTDSEGQGWHRKAKRGDRLDERRIRSLLRRDDVALVIWESFETARYDERGAKRAAADALAATAARSEDVVAHEWRADDGGVLLMLEHHC